MVLVLGTVLGIPLIPYLPPPGGQFLVGTAQWSLDREGKGSLPLARGGCRLSARLWYPAEPSTGSGRAPYDSAGAGLLSGARWVRTSATANAALSSRLTRYPVLLSLPGWDGARGENTAFVQDLASHGFVIAAIGYDDPACAGVDISSRGAVATDMDFSSEAAFERTLAVAHEKIDRVAEAASHVIDALQALDGADPAGRFGGRLDLNRLGVVGYSLGGAIAMQLCGRDMRVKAAVNVDGWFFDAVPGGWIKQPLMIIGDDAPMPPPTDLDSLDPERRYPAVLDYAHDRRLMDAFGEHGGVLVTVLGSSHLDFSDAAYLSRITLLEGRRPDGAIIRTAADYSAAFFGQVLNGETSPLFSNPPPGVRLQRWDRSAHKVGGN
ncbi:MAG TPA: hypothetical protein VGG79_15835 [Roseiarcus sp.]